MYPGEQPILFECFDDSDDDYSGYDRDIDEVKTGESFDSDNVDGVGSNNSSDPDGRVMSIYFAGVDLTRQINYLLRKESWNYML